VKRELPLVSAVVPAWNAARHLQACLASVLAQRGPFTLEVIVVDDGSQDNSAEIARGHADVRCIRQANAGPSAARNRGIEAAQGEYLAFLDADDLWPAGKLTAQLEVLQRAPEAALVFGDCRQFDAQGARARTEFEANGLGAAAWGRGCIVPQAYARLLDNNFITTGSVVARRAALERAGGFAEDLRLVEDLDLWLRLARQAPLAWCGRECLQRRRHDANISADGEALGLAFLDVLRRHAAGWQPGEAQALGVDARRLEAREWLHLAQLAHRRGDSSTAWRRLGRSVAVRPWSATPWRAAQAALGMLGGAAGRK